MLVNFSENIFKQALGVLFHNRQRLIYFSLISFAVVAQYKWLGAWDMEKFNFPVVPVSILGGALAIFLGFRNSSAYDRWWEARKIWGGIVNYSRTFSMQVLTFASSKHSDGKVAEETIREWQITMIRRHIAWLYALNISLRKSDHLKDRDQYLKAADIEKLESKSNKPTQIILMQGIGLTEAFDKRIIEDFRHMEMTRVQEQLYTFQGQAERIKKTVFPYYYNYFTRLFLWLFIICLPFALVESMSWMTVPMASAISFVFSILERSGSITEDPFEGRAADTPIATITRAIEIDLLEMLEEENIPSPLPMKTGKFSVTYFD